MAEQGLEGLDSLRKRFAAITDHRQLLGRLGLLSVQYAKEAVPRKTGNLGRTIRLGAVTEDSAQIIAGGLEGVGYARVVEFGSRPHDIVPRRKRVLHFVPGGVTGPKGNVRLTGTARSGVTGVFAMRVHHPGTKPHPYLIPSAQRAISDAGVVSIVQAWNEAA